MIDRSSLKKLSRYLISSFAFVIYLILVSVVGGIILGSIMPVITDLWVQTLNSDSYQVTAISNVLRVTIIFLGIYLITELILLAKLGKLLLPTWNEVTPPKDTQSKT